MSNVIQLHKNKCGCDECDWMKDLDEYEADLISFRTDPYAEGKGHFLGLVAQIADNTTLPNAVRFRACSMLWEHCGVRPTLEKNLQQFDSLGRDMGWRWGAGSLEKWVIRQ